MKTEIEKPDLEELPEESKFKRFIIFIAGIALIVLMVSYIFVSYPLSSIIEGKIESTPLEENVILLDTFSIIFDEQTRKELQSIYFAEQKVEFSVCLSGEKEGDDYYITSLYQPLMYEQGFSHVFFEPCSEETMIILHSHPYKSCIASQTDLNTLEKSKEENPEVLMVVMCEPARFSVYG